MALAAPWQGQNRIYLGYLLMGGDELGGGEAIDQMEHLV